MLAAVTPRQRRRSVAVTPPEPCANWPRIMPRERLRPAAWARPLMALPSARTV